MKDRRAFLRTAGTVGLAASLPPLMSARADDTKDKPEEEVAAAEDLMREHGVLNRVLLLFEEGLRRLRAKSEVTPELFHKPAALVRKFVEDYHEKLEEKFIFPAFEKKNLLPDLVKVLLRQHQAGRDLTDVVLREATANRFVKADSRELVMTSVEAFIRMYRPHEAREDTVLFPALHKVFTVKQLKDLGEQFEKEEDRLFGDEGFEKTVDQVAGLEKELGIYDLDQFTPKIQTK